MKESKQWHQCQIDISDDDVLEAMKTVKGFLDITPGDFREIYKVAYAQAMARLSTSVKAKDIMTSQVISIQEDASLLEAAELMAIKTISGLPVMDQENSRITGVVSEMDFLNAMGKQTGQSFMHVMVHCLKNNGCMAVRLRNVTVRDIMTSPPYLVEINTPVAAIATLLELTKINRVPVVDNQSELVGIITRTDIVQSYCIKSD